MDKLGMDEDMPIESPLVTKAIERAQKKVEMHNFSIRKHVLEYDDVMNQQREVIYTQRYKILDGDNLKSNIWGMIEHVIDASLNIYANEKVYPEEWDLKGLMEYINDYCVPHPNVAIEELATFGREELRERLLDVAEQVYNEREAELGEDNMRELERVVMLKVLDNKWIEHLDDMDNLRQGINLRAYGQRDPLIEYKTEAFDMFQQMMGNIQDDIVLHIYRIKVIVQPQDYLREAHATHENSDSGPVKNEQVKKLQKPVSVESVTGRNEACPCGSGKKFKRCCGAN